MSDLAVPNTTEEKALSLLGAGINAEQAASALGVTPSRISQLLSNEEFAGKVAELRYQNLTKHNERDASYDSLEDKLREKLEKQLGLIMKPDQIIRALHVVNNLKRRGQSAPDQIVNQQNIVSITIPTQIIQKFTTNVNNQVIATSEQSLETIQSGTLLKQAEANNHEQITHEHQEQEST
jgi:hypothetical protein